MNNDHLKKALQSIAEKAIPKESLDMWTTIENEMQKQQFVKKSHRSSLSQLIIRLSAIMLTLSLMAVAGVYAYSQIQPENSSQLDELRQAGLVATYQSTQTVNGYTVSLLEAYADTRYIRVHYQVDIQNPPSDIQPVTFLSDASGKYFFSNSNGAVEPIAPNDFSTIAVDTTFYTQTLYQGGEYGWQVDNAPYETLGVTDSIDLKLTVGFTTDHFAYTGGPFDLEKLEQEDYPVFEIPFTVTIGQPIILEPHLEETVNGQSIRLEYLEITPASTLARICFPLPDEQDWQPSSASTLEINGNMGLLMGGGMTQRPTLEEVDRCFNLDFFIVFDEELETLTLTIEKLQRSIPSEQPEFWSKVEAKFAEDYDIDIDAIVADHGIRIDIVSKPTGMTDADVYQLIPVVQESLVGNIEGPWVFKVTIPNSKN